MTIMPIQQVMTMASVILSQGQPNKPDIPALTERLIQLTRAVDFWNRWMIAGLAVAAMAALWLALTTRLTIVRQKELTLKQGELDAAKEGQLQLQLSSTETRRIALVNRIIDIFGPRQLTAQQSTEVVKKLAGLRGIKVDIYVFKLGSPYNPTEFSDDSALGMAFVRTLKNAGLDAEGWLLDSCQDSGASNLVVGIVGNNPEDLTTAKRVLDSLPTEIGVWPKVEPNFFPMTCAQFSNLDPSAPNKRTHEAKISIAIGRKITPILTREMLEPPDEGNIP
jgi:hypothetical protein